MTTEMLHGGRCRTPEESLIFAILGLAVVDLFGGRESTVAEVSQGHARREAMTFLTEAHGPWAAHRRELCDAVGMDSDHLRRRVITILEGGADVDRGNRKTAPNMAKARALWAEAKPAPVTEGPRAKRYNAEELYRLLPNEQFSALEIMQLTRADAKPVHSLLGKLEKRGLIERIGGGLFEKRPLADTPAEPLRLPRIVPKIDPMKAAKDAVYALLREPHRHTDVMRELDGRVTENKIITILRAGVESGELIRDEKRRFRLAGLVPTPQSLVEATG